MEKKYRDQTVTKRFEAFCYASSNIEPQINLVFDVLLMRIFMRSNFVPHCSQSLNSFSVNNLWVNECLLCPSYKYINMINIDSSNRITSEYVIYFSVFGCVECERNNHKHQIESHQSGTTNKRKLFSVFKKA